MHGQHTAKAILGHSFELPLFLLTQNFPQSQDIDSRAVVSARALQLYSQIERKYNERTDRQRMTEDDRESSFVIIAIDRLKQIERKLIRVKMTMFKNSNSNIMD